MKGLVFVEVLERVLYAIHELKKASATHIKIGNNPSKLH